MTRDETVGFSAEDPEMVAAIREAKHSFAQFLHAFLSPSENQKNFLVKAAFVEAEQVEHIWIADLDFSGPKPRGVIANEPQLSSLKYMHPVEFDPAQITDWMYIENGYLVGGYTTCLIRQRMTPEERQTYDFKAPYKFRD